MQRRLPNVLCGLGAALLSAAFWLLHPSAGLATTGALCVGFGVHLHRALPPLPQQPK